MEFQKDKLLLLIFPIDLMIILVKFEFKKYYYLFI
jgi:hypothetical protein